MNDRIRLAVLALGALIVFAVINLQIFGKEAIVREGRTVLLRLAPVDPRSLDRRDLRRHGSGNRRRAYR